MSSTDPNLEALVEGVAAIAQLLDASDGDRAAVDAADAAWRRFEMGLRSNAAEVPLGELAQRFRLGSFELKCVTLALASHIEPRMTELVARRGRQMFARTVTVRLAVDSFCRTAEAKVGARRSFLPGAPLIKNRIITLGRVEAGAPEGLLARQIQLTTPVLRRVLREDELSDTVEKLARLEQPEVSLLNVILPPEKMRQIRELVEQHSRYRELITDWGFDRVLPYGRGLTLLFSGPSGTGKTLLAQALANRLGRPLLFLSASDLPDKEGVDASLREIMTEATLRDAVVLIDECEALLGRHDKRKATAFKAIEDFDGVLILTTQHPDMLDDGLERRIIYHLPFEIPEPDLRREIWEVHLPPEVPLDEGIDLETLANKYDFSGGQIKNAILVAVNRSLAHNPTDPKLTMEQLEEGCVSQLRYALEALTVRTTTHLRMADIVLEEEQEKKVRELIAAIRNQSIVLNRWGFGRKLVTGKGITALFDGPPGTGKTFCSEIIAGEFDRALYRVNLPEVVSKWVGETEKNVRAIFQQARVSHAMLLFDEADALFGARVAEAHTATDRHDNMTVNLLLQEIERFPGVCILTTNSYGALDRALVRRIQFRVTFEEPGADQRQRIWEVLCPPEAPMADDVDFEALAKRWELTGGMIKNALLRAAYWACDADSDITQAILMDACNDEYRAAGKVARDPGFVPPPRERVHEESEATAFAHITPAEGGPAVAPPLAWSPAAKAAKKRSAAKKEAATAPEPDEEATPGAGAGG